MLEHYLFGGRNGDLLLALGVGSLFNHSKQPNLSYTVDQQLQLIHFRAARDIAANEELTIFYGDNLWFEDSSAFAASSPNSMLHQHLDEEHAFLAGLQLDGE